MILLILIYFINKINLLVFLSNPNLAFNFDSVLKWKSLNSGSFIKTTEVFPDC